jgi:tape measure domain-containing protein
MADRKVEIVITQVNGGGSDKVKSALRSVGDEVARINKETQEQAKKTDRIIQEATKARVNAEIAEEKRLERTRKQAASNFISEIKRLDQETKSLSRTGSIFAGSFLGFSAAGAAAGAVTSITSAAKQGIGVWLDYASKVEQAKIGFTTMIGSADEAGKHLKALQDFAKATPFEFEELVTASQKMQGVGIAASKVIPLLKDVGNALAASGRLGDLPEAVKALGDIQAKGKLAGQEIIQLANAGIPAIKMLSEYLGKSSADILKLSEDGKISADILFAALHKMSSERFGDAMERQSKTFMGAMSNITDALKQTAQTAFQPLYDRISGLAVKFSQEISQQQGDLEKVGGVIAKYIGQGLSEGLIAATEGIGKAIGGRLAGIFTKAEFIDPISKGFAEGVAKGIVEGFGRVNVRNMILEWVIKAMTGADVHLGRTSGSGDGSTTGYTRTFPGTSGFNLNLGGGSGPFRTNTFGEPSNATAYTRLFHGGAGNATISVVPMPGDTSKSGGKSGKGGKSGGMKDVLPAFGSMRELAISSGNPQWDAWFVEMGRKFDVDPNILLLQAGKESSYNKNAVSPKGAKGFSQFMPGTAKRFDVDTSSVKDSIRGQAEYMGLLLSMFGGDYSKALAGYNAGEGAVQKFGGVPPYKETRDYVARIKGGYASRVRKGASYGTYEIPEEGGLSTSGGISDELGNLKKPNEELLRVYKDMAETLFNLEEHTQKEVFLMDVKLGKYPELNDATVAEIANTYELIDATKKATDEKKAAADKQADYEKRVQSEVENLKREEYQKTRDVIEESLDYLSRGDFKGFGRAILERQRQAVVEKTTDWILDKLGIQNPDDTPELREAKKQTKLLQAIAGQAGGRYQPGRSASVGCSAAIRAAGSLITAAVQVEARRRAPVVAGSIPLYPSPALAPCQLLRAVAKVDSSAGSVLSSVHERTS